MLFRSIVLDGNRMLIPIYVDNVISSGQHIDIDGRKQFVPDGRVKGGYYYIKGSSDAIAICEEWIARGYKDSLLPKFKAEVTTSNPEMPWWLGLEQLHRSHQSNLKRKDSNYYKFKVKNNLPYIWCNADGTYYEGITK